MALDKTTVEVPFTKGQNQKASPEVVEMDVPYVLRNVELTKTSGYTKRKGRTSMGSTVIGATDPVTGEAMPIFENIARLATREDELVALSEANGAWGSAGGAGSAGDSVFSYSSTLSSWKVFGKIGRPTSEIIDSAAPTNTSLSDVDSAVANGFLMTVVDRDTGAHATVIDLASDSRVVNNQLIAQGVGNIVCYGLGNSLYVLAIDGASDDIVGYVYDTTDPDAGFVGPTVVASSGSSTGNAGFDVTTDGILLYFSYHYINGGTAEIRIQKTNAALTTIGSPVTVRSGTSGTGGQNAIHCNAGAISIAYGLNIAASMTIGTKRVTNNLSLALSTEVVVSSGETDFLASNSVRVATFNSEKHFVFYDRSYDSSTETAGLDGSGTLARVIWSCIEGTQAVPVAVGLTHEAVNLKLFSEPFVLSDRLYLPVLGRRHVQPGSGPGAMGYYNGVYLCEVDPEVSTNPTATLMPVGANFLDIVGQVQSRKAPVYQGKAYVTTTRRQHNPFDPGGQLYYVEYPIVSTIVYDFADRYRWQPANHAQNVMFSGALPYVFDGQNVHECGFVWRPEITGAQAIAGAGLSVGTYSYRVTYEARDNRGNRWSSQVSYAVEGLIAASGGNLQGQVCVSTLSLSMWGDSAAYFPCRVYVVLWRGTTAQVANGEWVRVQEQEVYPYDTSNLVMTDGEADADVDSAERLYIYGGELENTLAPPCRVLFQHRDRLIAYNEETGTVWYTKPMTPERGIEWCLNQQIPVAEKVIAGASLEHAAILLTRTKVYALEGDGPGATGTPADAFSRLTLINADIGCSEACAAWRSPAGIFFRSDSGIWLITRSMEFQYTGAPVEDEVALIDYTVGSIVDTARGCFRLFYHRDEPLEDESHAHSLVYWYDTGRWSLDDYLGPPPTSATMWQGRAVHTDGDDVWQPDPALYVDGGADFYPMGVTMGWARFGDLHAFKRVWRFLLTLKMHVGTTLRVSLYKNFDGETVVQEKDFSYTTVSATTGQLRIHLKHQKITAIQAKLLEIQDGEDPELQGFDLFGAGFELGIKRGAVKLGLTRTAPAAEA